MEASTPRRGTNKTLTNLSTPPPPQNAARLAAGLPPEDIDLSHRQTLDALLATDPWQALIAHHFQDTPSSPTTTSTTTTSPSTSSTSTTARDRCTAAWHHQPAWPDVLPALAALRAALPDADVLVHANGTTRLQLDLARSSGLRDGTGTGGSLLDGLFSSELLGVLKPAPESYERCLALLRRRPDECVMVAAHAYDTRGARAVGMRTVYVYRWTDDVREDQAVVRGENDVYLEGMEGLADAIQGLGRE